MNHNTHNNKSVVQHIAFLIVGILILAGIYLYFRNPIPVTLGAIGRARVQPGQKVLDVGCGTGQMAITARMKAPPTAEIYGTDASPKMIDRAREHATKAGVNVDCQTETIWQFFIFSCQ